MSQSDANTPALLNIQEAATTFRVSRRTIERKIASKEIADTQLVVHGRETRIYVNELVRVFGEPKAPVVKGKNDERHDATPRANVARTAENSDLVAHLKAQIEYEREQAEARLREVREREQAERERAERYERELAELRREYTATLKLLAPPPKEAQRETTKPRPWWRVFG